MIFLVPAVLAAFGLYSGRDALVWLAVGLFVWLSWNRKKTERRRSKLFAVPMPDDDVKVPEIGGGGITSSATPDPPGGRCGGCA